MLDMADIGRQLAEYRTWTLYIGFSGGADSLALLVILCKLQKDLDLRLTAVHCEHGFRGADSLADLAFCRDFCRERGIPFLQETLEVPANRLPGETDEAAARRLRQMVWQRLGRKKEKTAIVLAHHAGDRRENLLLRLARGSNVSGLCGLRAVRKIGGVTYLRPLLHAEKKDLEACLRGNGINCWRTDGSNADIRYRRNFIRQELLPRWFGAMPYAEGGLVASLDALEVDAEYLEEAAARIAGNMAPGGGKTGVWREIAPALRGRVLRLLARRELDTDWIADRSFLRAFDRMLRDGGPLTDLPLAGADGAVWGLRHGCWNFIPSPAETPVPQLWAWRKGPAAGFSAGFPKTLPEKITGDTAFFDAEKLPEILLISGGVPGDRMIPFGRRTPVRWKVLRTDRGIPAGAAPPLLRLPGGKSSGLH